ncbi:hypothetical protein WYH_02225 [Croceibacterium atlanticum]|uniref:Uncharacterized protein n=1 Tax=Croceibacterium atlanticum TaxID=1267766 RepID=A0A0F7KS24_9SPHN|nr:hypothetical protein WYH_02225 [Croceibacterium atlanticum]
MRCEKENRSDRESKDREVFSASWICRAGCRNRRRSGSWAIARGVRKGAGRQQQCGRLRGNAGLPGKSGGGAPVLAARGEGREATGITACARIDRDRNRSAANGADHVARSGGVAACSSRCGALCIHRCGSDRVVAPSARARPDCKPASGAGGRSIGRHSLAAADRGRTRPQRCADTLERKRSAFCGPGGRSARPTRLQRQIVASARPPRWRMLASGVGS